MNVWEVEESGPVEEEPPKRKRRTQNQDPLRKGNQQAMTSSGRLVLINLLGSVEMWIFTFIYVGESGTILTIGSLYYFDFLEIQFLFAQVSQKIRNFSSLHFCYVLWWRVKLKVWMGVFVVH